VPDIAILPSIAEHGSSRLPSVEVDSYNIELKDYEGFIGDRASKGAFRDLLENWRKPLRKAGKDPFGDQKTEDIPKKDLDALLTKGDPEAAAIVHAAIEDFAQGDGFGHPALSQDQSVERHRADRSRRRFPGQPDR
jgi:hypothetical protein